MKNENKNWSKLGSVSLYWIYHLRLLTECYILYKKAVKLLDQLLVNFSLGNGLCKIVDFGWYKILSFSSHWNCGSSGWPDAEKTLALRRSAQLEGSLSKTQSLALVTQLQKCSSARTSSKKPGNHRFCIFGVQMQLFHFLLQIVLYNTLTL